ncbi:hypothetical protein [Ornithinimicrobium panacihumi]
MATYLGTGWLGARGRLRTQAAWNGERRPHEHQVLDGTGVDED